MASRSTLPPFITDHGDKKSVTDDSLSDEYVTRPEIDYSSVGALCSSTWNRFVSLWTKRFILSLLAGQVVSLCITCTNVTTEELTTGNWQLPTTQTFFLYQTFYFIDSHPDRFFSPDTSPFAPFTHPTRSTGVCF